MSTHGSGGGGSEDAAYFRQRAEIVFSKMQKAGLDEVLIDDLRESLKETKIVVVETLMENKLFKVPDEKYLVAWGRPGLIQLKASYWAKESRNGIWLSSDHQILHEITRASKTYHNLDESYEVSIGELQLNKVPEGTVLRFGRPCILKTEQTSTYGSEGSGYRAYGATISEIKDNGEIVIMWSDRSSGQGHFKNYEFLPNAEKQFNAYINSGVCYDAPAKTGAVRILPD